MSHFAERRRFAAAICERDGGLLLVRRDDGPGGSHWTLPLYEAPAKSFPALDEELRRETGLEMLDWAGVRFFVQVLPGEQAPESIIFAVGVDTAGELDEASEACRFVPQAEAIELLRDHPDRSVSEPTLCYLNGECSNEMVWAYRPTGDGELELVARMG